MDDFFHGQLVRTCRRATVEDGGGVADAEAVFAALAGADGGGE